MIIVLFDGTRIECDKIEIAMTKDKLIYDEDSVISMGDVMKILSNKRGGKR